MQWGYTKVLLSIIIPFYNVEKYIGHCLESVYSQIDAEAEVIIVNDGSTDHSLKIVQSIVKKYDKHIKTSIIQNPSNGGPGSARNEGAKIVTGDYLTFIDSDDYVSKEWYFEIKSWIENNKDVDAFIFDSFSVTPKGKIIKHIDMRRNITGKINVKQYPEIVIGQPAAWNKIYRASLFREQNIKFPENYWYEDTSPTRVFIANTKRIMCVNKPIYNYVQRKGSITKTRNISKMCNDIIKMLKKMSDDMSFGNVGFDYSKEIEYISIRSCLLVIVPEIMACKKKATEIKTIIDFIKNEYPQALVNDYLKKDEYNRCKLLLEENTMKYYFRYELYYKLKQFAKSILMS